MNTPPTNQLSPNQRALLKIRDLKRQVEVLKSNHGRSAFGGAIAIVSMACRFPRTAKTPEAFWQSLVDQTDEVGSIPNDRWDLDAFYDHDPATPGKMYASQGAFLDGIDQMDPEFFGISPREATWVDPQQRLLMEVGYEALQRAGWQPETIGENTGVFVGWMHNDYQNEASDSFLNLNPYIATGAAGSFLCGRLAYYLGLQGPSIAIDTACSSSLVAVHLACQSLQQRDCDRALVGGVNAICSPTTNILTCKLKALSPSGHSRAFDASADGYVRGEGCGVITLKRLDDAQRDGDPVLGVIRGSAVGHNGFSSGLTAPNPKAQEKVIRAALSRAQISPENVNYLEAHGTGTELGDPIEMQAAAAALATGRTDANPLLVGSVKTNIGHLEAAAGMAGIIKVLLAMQNDSIPGQLGFETPNPHIPWDKLAVKVVTDSTPWPNEQQKIAGVSAFGMSGTNAHLIIEAPVAAQSSAIAPTSVTDRPTQPGSSHTSPSTPHLITVSGKSDEAVRELARAYANHIAVREADGPDGVTGATGDSSKLGDIAFTLATGRSHFEHRGAILATDHQQAIERLKLLQRHAPGNGVFWGQHRRAPKIAWQFTGQGSQYPSMSQSLYRAWPVFRSALDQCDQWLSAERDISLLEVMFGDDESSIHQTQWTQPAIFAVQMGLVELLNSWGLKPDAVLGHSVGQYAAACVAGVMSWQDGLSLLAHRGRLIGDLPTGGQMLAVFANLTTVESAIQSIDHLSLAANNISHIAISGPVAAIESAEALLNSQSVRTKRLKTSHAFHSDLMAPALKPFAKIAEKIEFKSPTLPLICNMTGQVCSASAIFDSQYWASHIRQPVRYGESIEAAAEFGCDVLLELGPHAVLSQMAAGVWPNSAANVISCLERDSDDQESIVSAVGKLYACGAEIDFNQFTLNSNPSSRPNRVVLPTYPFERRRFWGPDKPRAAHAAHHTAHGLLGSPIALAGNQGEQRFQSHIEADSPVWLADHEVMGQTVMPGAAYIEMALQVAKSQDETDFAVLENLAFEQPLCPTERTQLQTVVQNTPQAKPGAKAVEIYSAATESNAWSRHFSATLGSTDEDSPPPPVAHDLDQLKTDSPNEIDAAHFYASMAGLGLNYGAAFQTIDSIRTSQNAVLTQLTLRSDMRGYTIAPPLLDGAIHSLAVGIIDSDEDELFLPVGVKRVKFYQSAQSEIWCYAQWTQPQGDTRTADLTLLDTEGNTIAVLEELTVRKINRAAMKKMAGSGSERLLYELQWQRWRLPAPTTDKRRWMIVHQNEGSGARLAKRLIDQVANQLRGAGHDVACIELAQDNQPIDLSDRTATITGSSEDWQRALIELGTDQTPWIPEGVLWCVADDRGSYVEDTAATRRHVEGVLNLIDTIGPPGSQGAQLECGLQWLTVNGIVTQHQAESNSQTKQAQAGEMVCVAQAQYAGLARVIGAEQPMLRCRLIDIEAPIEETQTMLTSADEVVSFLTTETTENQFAVRAGEFYVPRLKPTKRSNSKPSSKFEARADSSYLITGGLGALGRQAGKWLAEKGAGQVVLVSRRQPDQATQTLLDQITQLGCQVFVESADFGNPDDVNTLMAKFGNEFLPLKGVIHAAGVLDDALIADQSWSRFEKVLSPKIIGATLLHEATRKVELDFFILYSSAASVLGSPGQSNYALANAYLDGLAWHRRQLGLPGLAINWGPWSDGMADDPRITKRMAMQGITPLTSTEAHEAMEKMILGDLRQTTVMDVDWRRMQSALGGELPSLLSELAPMRKRSSRGDSEFVSKLKKLTGPPRRALMVSTVEQMLQGILSTDGTPETDRPLIEMGLDSLMAVEFGTELQLLLGDAFTIAPTMLFDHHTIDAISDHVLELVQESDSKPNADKATGDLKPASIDAKSNSTSVITQDIAIVGVSCRFPGAKNVDQFWDNLLSGVDSVCSIPADRWDIDKFYSADRQPGKMYTKQGGFIDDIGDFDAEFFGLSAEEACWTDPQHRMLLEHSYRAMEHAGICPRPLADNAVGVFMGIMGQDYAFLPRLENAEIVETFQGAGLSHSAGVGRISYHFGFEGPSVAIDTASSSSLVALFQAMRSLQEGACNMALAGGVNAILAPVNSLLMSKASLLSPQGRCKSFSADADGFGRGEGCGVVVLKRLSDAQDAGDSILAVVKGGAVSHNGFSSAITAPSGKAQSRVISDALADAGVAPNEVQYLEAHGTGTEYGDPMEISAAAAVYGKGRSNENALLVGSVKANISHLEAAGGVSGLIKTVMAIHTGTLPGQLHFEQPSPHIPWERMPVKMVTNRQSWPECKTRYAGITALGLVGTNAHIVLASAPESSTTTESEAESAEDDSVNSLGGQHQLLLLSGKDTDGLKRVVKRFEDYLSASPEINFPNMCYSAATGRQHFDHRIAMIATDRHDAARQLRKLRDQPKLGDVKKPITNPSITFWFDGVNTNAIGALAGLAECYPVVRETLTNVDQRIEQFQQTDFWKQIATDSSLSIEPLRRRVERFSKSNDDQNSLSDVTDTGHDLTLFALQASLYELWRHWGIEPDRVAGWGIGQYSAACSAGAIGFLDAATLVAARQFIGNHLTRNGEPVDGNAEGMLDQFEAYADELNFYPPNRTLACSISGAEVPMYKSLGGRYWRDHCLHDSTPEQIQCAQTIAGEVESGYVIELSAGSTTIGWNADATVIRGSAETHSAAARILETAGVLYSAGVQLNFQNMFDSRRYQKTVLPSYPMNKQRYWITEIADHQPTTSR